MKKQQKEKSCALAVLSYDMGMLRVVGNYCQLLDCFSKVDLYRRGSAVFADLQERKAIDIIILDEDLCDGDAIGFAEQFAALEIHPKPVVIALCTQRTYQVEEYLLNCGVAHCVTKPFQLKSLVDRAILMYQLGDARLRKLCDNLYARWGVQADSRGAQYFTDAVTLVTQSNEKLAIRKEVVLVVAKMNGTTLPAVDSAMRRFLTHAWQENTVDYLRFKDQMDLSDKPSVQQMIYALKRFVIASQNTILIDAKEECNAGIL